ncbi:MAG TPA: hypothetical protein VHU90_13615 [Galbitalea sp.]|jgi:hypothetical protein|nr:hypothetical protein [Galbitalea sp.]
MDPDDAAVLALKWLLKQRGEPLVVFNRKAAVENDEVIEAAIYKYKIRYGAPGTLRGSGWKGGAILAPWAADEVLEFIDGWLHRKAHAVCVMGFRPGSHDAWISARGAVNLADGQPLGKSITEIMSDLVVRIAIDHAAVPINHNNKLVQAEDKSYFVRTLQELVRGGHHFDLDELCAYMMATGWTGDEVKQAREYGQRVLDGKRFNLRSTFGPVQGTCKHWEAEAAGEDSSN